MKRWIDDQVNFLMELVACVLIVGYAIIPVLIIGLVIRVLIKAV
jgi:hypothetical protein